MGQNDSRNGRRIAGNTLMLYVRMLFLMLVGLYTSRVVLEALGENDFGIYNVVGGVVALFSIISGALSSAISRFMTYELGRKDSSRLGDIFSSAVTVQLILSAVVVAAAEPAGLWFIENKMTIEPGRITAARAVFQFSVLTFVINLISVPYHASIIAHERMSAFAYIGIFEGLGRLAVAFLILRSPMDRLVYYAALMCGVAVAVRVAYTVYCRRNFSECRFRPSLDRGLLKQMFSFAGWNFIGVASGVLRDQGGNILVNLFAGPAVNAARGVAFQLNGAVQNFVTNFMTALNPQITKSYAAGERAYMFNLVRKGARFSYYLLLILAVPVLFNTDYLMGLWLKDVPEGAVQFVRLFLIFALSESLSNPLVTVMLATGKIRDYQLIVGGLQLLNLPVSYLFLRAGAAPEVTVVVAIVVSQVCLFARLFMLRRMTGLSVRGYLSEVYVNVLWVSLLAVLGPVLVMPLLPDGFWSFCGGVAVCLVWTGLSVLLAGCRKSERQKLRSMLRRGGEKLEGEDVAD